MQTLRIVCQVRAEDSRICFTWSDGSGSFKEYSISEFFLEKFRTNAVNARAALGRLVDLSNTGDNKEQWKCLHEIAQFGNGLYREIFRPEESRTAEAWLKEALARDEIESLEIVLDATSEAARANLNVPWSIVYDQPPDLNSFNPESASGPLAHFWGHAYNLACGFRVDPLRRRPRIENPQVLFVIDAGAEAEMGRLDAGALKQLRDFTASRNIPLANTRTQLEVRLAEHRPDLVYWFSHATPDLLYLGDDKLSASDLFDIFDTANQVRRGGIVFLNACQTAQGASHGLAYLTAVTHCGMSGIIGTEQETIDLHANRIGLEFLDKFLTSGEPIARIMTDLRRQYPLALIYATYCPPHITVARLEASEVLEAAPAMSPDATRQLSAPVSAGNLLGDVVGVAEAGPLPPEPYLGLAAYNREQRPLFVGRRDDCDRFTSILNTPGTKMLVLQGESGVGKTSFLRAEVIPFLEEESIGYRFLRNRRTRTSPPHKTSSDIAEGDTGIIFVRAGKDLIAELANAITDFASTPYVVKRPVGESEKIDLLAILDQVLRSPLPITSAEDLTNWFRSHPNAFHDTLCAFSSTLPFTILVIVDQAEEIFTQKQGLDALAVLSKAATNEGDYKVVVSLRTEYFGRLISALRKGQPRADTIREYLLVDFGQDDLVEAIERPTWSKPVPYSTEIPFERYGFTYEPGLTNEIARGVREYASRGQDSVLPLVQVISTQLFDLVKRRPPNLREIKQTDLNALGGVAGGMDRHVGALIDKLFANSKDRAAIKHLLAELVLEQSDGTLTTAITEESELKSGWRGAITFEDALAIATQPDYRLLKRGQLRDNAGSSASYLSLGHDALARVAQAWKQKERNARRRKNEAVAAMLAVMVISVFLYLWQRADSSSKMFEQASIVSNVERLSSKAQLLYDSYPDLSILMAITASKLVDNAETQVALLNVLERDTRLVALLSGHSNGVCEISFSPDGSLLATMDCTGRLVYWDVRTMARKYGEINIDLKQDVLGLAILAGNQQLAVAFRSGQLQLWNIAGGDLTGTCTFDGPVDTSKEDRPLESPGMWRTGAFSQDGTKFAYGNGESKAVTIWSLPNCASEPKHFELPSKPRSLRYASDSELLGVAGRDGIAYAIDAVHGSVVQKLPTITGAFKDPEIVDAIAFSTDSKQLAGAYFGGQVQYQKLGGPVISLQNRDNSPTAIAFGPNDKTLAIANFWNGQVQILDLQTKRDVAPLRAHSSGGVMLRSSNDGQILASGGTDSYVALWELGATCRICSEIPGIQGVSSGRFDARGQLVLSTFAPVKGSESGERRTEEQLQIWTGKELKLVQPNVRAIQIDSSKSDLVFIAEADQLRILEPGTGKELPPIPLPARVGFRKLHLAISGGDKLVAVAVCDTDCHTQIWNLRNRNEAPKIIPKEFDDITAMRFAIPSDTLLVAEKSGDVTFWDPLKAEQARPPFVGHIKPHLWKGAAFSDDGGTYVEGEENRIRLWNIRSETELGIPLIHEGSSFIFAFTRDGRRLASASDGGTIRLWDLTTQQSFGPVLHAGYKLSHLEFSPDGTRLLSIGNDKALIWTLNPAKWREIGGQVVNRNLCLSEWNQFFPNHLPFDKSAFPNLPECKEQTSTTASGK